MSTTDAGTNTSITVVVVAYNMTRELPRTLRTLAPEYQRGIAADDYDIVVVDNGSDAPVTDEIVDDFGGRLRVTRLHDAPASPARAANVGLEMATGALVGVLIDGARMASPGLLAMARRAAALHERAVVATLAWHLGPDAHMNADMTGYDQAVEDALLAECGWEHDGYRLFSVSTLAGSSRRGWFGPLGESNALFLSAALWKELSGFEESFSTPGGGRLNHDLWRRACELPNTEVIILLGEGTFHQIHGGAYTSARFAKAEADAEYERIRGRRFEPPVIDPVYFGRVPASSMPHLEASVRWARRDDKTSSPRA